MRIRKRQRPLHAVSAALGMGKYGQLDLAGSLNEWVLDKWAMYPKTCENCVQLGANTLQSLRGGSWLSGASAPVPLPVRLRHDWRPLRQNAMTACCPSTAGRRGARQRRTWDRSADG